MALYRFEAKIISRDGGRSAVGASAYRTGKCVTASAAYRNGAVIVDERTGKRFDYSKKAGVLGAEIMLPSGAPEWMRDRTQLWNAVEKIEKRKDAQLARDFVISLPHELPHETRVELTRSFVRKHFVDKGYAADIAWHLPDKRGDPRNYHAHVMVTLRRVNHDGFAQRKDRAPGKLHPMQQWTKELQALRKDWAEHGADALDRAGLKLVATRFSVGHFTLKKQRALAIARSDHEWAEQLDREAEPKQGPLATQMEREGRESHAGNDRRATKARNAELANLKAEHAAATAEIIDLQIERIRRGHMDDMADEFLKQQSGRESALLEEAKRLEAGLAAFRQRKDEEAEEARRREAVKAKEGDITDAKGRYAQALGDHYDARDPYSSLARAAMAEYSAFHKQQQEYRRQEAAEQNPEKRYLIRLAREIEADDYMAITSTRLGEISRVVTGPEALRRAKAEGRRTEVDLHEERASYYGEQGKVLREQRSEFLREMAAREKSSGKEQDPVAQNAGRSSQGHQTPSQSAAKSARSEYDTGARNEVDRNGELSDRGQRAVSDRVARIGAGMEQEHAQRATQTRGRAGRA